MPTLHRTLKFVKKHIKPCALYDAKRTTPRRLGCSPTLAPAPSPPAAAGPSGPPLVERGREDWMTDYRLDEEDVEWVNKEEEDDNWN